MITRLYLIRHPHTDYSQNKRYCGITDISLNELGISQAHKLANHFKDIFVDVIYSSPYKRAQEAARIIFSACGGPASGGGRISKIILVESLRELNFGSWEGLRHREALKKYPKEYTHWLGGPLNASPVRNSISNGARPPKGETLLDLKERVITFLGEILKNDKGKTIAVISHGGPIRVILCEALKLGLKDLWNLIVEPSSISYLEYKGNALVNFSLNLKI